MKINNISMSTYIRFFGCIVVCAFLTSGCWDRREINDIAFVLASAIDKVDGLYRVSVLIPLPGNMGGFGGGGGGTGGAEPYTIQSETGLTIRNAVDKMQLRLSRRIFFGHRRVLLISEEVAKEGLTPIVETITRIHENRLSTFIAITQGSAKDYLAAKVSLERFSAELMRELLQSDATLRTSEKDVITEMNIMGHDALIPYLELTKTNENKSNTDHIVSAGFVITKAGKQVGVMKDKAASTIRLLMPKFKSYSDVITLKEGKMTYNIHHVVTSIKPRLVGNQINFIIKVDADADIEEFLINKNILNEMSYLNASIAGYTRDNLINVLETLKTSGSDVVGFGNILNRSYPFKWNTQWKENWYAHFAKVNFKVSVNVNIHRVGMINENIAERES